MSAVRGAAVPWRNDAPSSSPLIVNQGQPQATTGKPQREMPFLAEVRGPKRVAADFIRLCKNELEALNLCMNLSGLADETIRDRLGIDKGHFSRIRKGRGNFPPTKRVALMNLCGNIAPIQYEALQVGFSIQEQDKDARIALLQAQIAAIEGERVEREAA